jgi:hypothetical protein
VFAAGTLHIVNMAGHVTFAANPRACTVRVNAQQTTTIEGGTGRFAGATGRFAGTVSGSGVARCKLDGSCDQQHPTLAEIDTVTATGTLTF